MNKICIQLPEVIGNKIVYHYIISGEWREAFNPEYDFNIEYSCSLSGLPSGVAVVPLIANILPISWIYDAEIIVPVCDEDFYNSIEEFKQGYRDMYPMMQFLGKMTVGELQKNIPDVQEGSAAFFSGGVDAFNTLTCHAEEKPILLTLWGADVKLDDKEGWFRVETHLRQTAVDFETDYVTIRSGFRRFLKEGLLTHKVAESGDGWWHGFQHGIGIISHAAPAMYVLGKHTAYFASSFTVADKGKVTCASDPTIDNFVRFCGCNVVHDGYEFTRQMKVHNITQFSKISGKHIPLRVCWESSGGSNCCNCEKCWRTMLGVYAEGFDPHDFGFEYTNTQLKHISRKMKYSGDPMFGRLRLRYKPIQDSMIKNIRKIDLPKSIRWFYNANVDQLSTTPVWVKIGLIVYRTVKRVKRRIHQ